MLFTNIFELKRQDEVASLLHTYSNHRDSYLTSPNYFLVTSRKGLKAFISKGYSIIFSDHPNLLDETIIYPPVNINQALVLKDLLTHYSSYLKRKIRIIRCGQNEINLIKNSLGKSVKLRQVKEYLLDWKYPSIIISVESVINKKGNKFKDLRYNINKVDQSFIEFSFLNTNHIKDALALVNKWSEKKVSQLFDKKNLSALYEHLLNENIVRNDTVGYVLYYKNKLVAFNILDKPIDRSNELTSLAFLADSDHHGIPSFMRYKVCQEVKSLGIEYLNIGGSETYGLYKFKKKLAPCKELNLSSVINT